MPKDKNSDRFLREKQEKEAIRAYFDHRREGVVVEVGANDPLRHTSQSLHLEKELDWRCVLIEPHPELAQQARELRKSAQVFEFACVSSDGLGEISFYIPIKGEDTEVHSHAAIEKNIDDHNYAHHRELRVQSKSLTSILDESNLVEIDLLSIDVEGAELEVLKGLDLEKYRPRLILLEDKHAYLDKHWFLKERGYRLVKRTCQNCWYIQGGEKTPLQSFSEKCKLLRRLYLSIWVKKTKLAWRKRSLAPFRSI